MSNEKVRNEGINVPIFRDSVLCENFSIGIRPEFQTKHILKFALFDSVGPGMLI
jgi:hypothetical protein